MRRTSAPMATPAQEGDAGAGTAAIGIDGVVVHPLASHRDARGDFTELFRRAWPGAPDAVQWSLVRSRGGTLRGVHLHVRHWDWIVVIEGAMRLGCADLRLRSATAGASGQLDLSGDRLAAVAIPPGVAHGFYFPERATHIYAVSAYWCPEEELGCHWADPALGIDWGAVPARPRLSARDAALPSLDALTRRLDPWRAHFEPS